MVQSQASEIDNLLSSLHKNEDPDYVTAGYYFENALRKALTKYRDKAFANNNPTPSSMLDDAVFAVTFLFKILTTPVPLTTIKTLLKSLKTMLIENSKDDIRAAKGEEKVSFQMKAVGFCLYYFVKTAAVFSYVAFKTMSILIYFFNVNFTLINVTTIALVYGMANFLPVNNYNLNYNVLFLGVAALELATLTISLVKDYIKVKTNYLENLSDFCPSINTIVSALACVAMYSTDFISKLFYNQPKNSELYNISVAGCLATYVLVNYAFSLGIAKQLDVNPNSIAV